MDVHRGLAVSEVARVRPRLMGIAPGVFAPGTHNAITDVAGVMVGHATVHEGDGIRTGVTAIRPHDENLYRARVPAAVFVGNGYGKLVGATQVQELGELETPILLTNTLAVWRVADALAAWMLRQPGMGRVRSVNPVVGETNDGVLNDIRLPRVGSVETELALSTASMGPVQQGCVGAGTGTIAFGWKGGIGTSSRVLPEISGAFTVGVLVQVNFGGVLQVVGLPVGIELGQHAFSAGARAGTGDGSAMIVIATDAPLSARSLSRMAARSMLGLGRTGSCAANGSGDYAIAFSTAQRMRVAADRRQLALHELANEAMTPLFQSVVEATEEAVYDALFMAETTTGNGVTVEALPLDRVRRMLAARGLQP